MFLIERIANEFTSGTIVEYNYEGYYTHVRNDVVLSSKLDRNSLLVNLVNGSLAIHIDYMYNDYIERRRVNEDTIIELYKRFTTDISILQLVPQINEAELCLSEGYNVLSYIKTNSIYLQDKTIFKLEY